VSRGLGSEWDWNAVRHKHGRHPQRQPRSSNSYLLELLPDLVAGRLLFLLLSLPKLDHPLEPLFLLQPGDRRHLLAAADALCLAKLLHGLLLLLALYPGLPDELFCFRLGLLWRQFGRLDERRVAALRVGAVVGRDPLDRLLDGAVVGVVQGTQRLVPRESHRLERLDAIVVVSLVLVSVFVSRRSGSGSGFGGVAPEAAVAGQSRLLVDDLGHDDVGVLEFVVRREPPVLVLLDGRPAQLAALDALPCLEGFRRLGKFGVPGGLGMRL